MSNEEALFGTTYSHDPDRLTASYSIEVKTHNFPFDREMNVTLLSSEGIYDMNWEMYTITGSVKNSADHEVYVEVWVAFYDEYNELHDVNWDWYTTTLSLLDAGETYKFLISSSAPKAGNIASYEILLKQSQA
jgi:hypothetical protein